MEGAARLGAGPTVWLSYSKLGIWGRDVRHAKMTTTPAARRQPMAGDDVLNICFHGIGTPQRQLEPGEDAYWVDTDRLQCPQPVPRQHGDQPGYYRVPCDRTGQHRCSRRAAMSARQSPPSATEAAGSPMIFPGSSPTAGPHRPGRPDPAIRRHGDLVLRTLFFTGKVPSASGGQDLDKPILPG